MRDFPERVISVRDDQYRPLGFYTALYYADGRRYFAPRADDRHVLVYSTGGGCGEDLTVLREAGLVGRPVERDAYIREDVA